MPSLSRSLCLGALLFAAPLAAVPAEAAPPAPPYHLAAGPDHGRLIPAGHPRRDDGQWAAHEWADDWRQDQRKGWRDQHRRWQPWPQPDLRHRPWLGMPHLLPPRAVERQLRRQFFQPVGRIELRHGVYLVRAIDPFGRRVLLAIDPVTGAVLGRHRRR